MKSKDEKIDKLKEGLQDIGINTKRVINTVVEFENELRKVWTKAVKGIYGDLHEFEIKISHKRFYILLYRSNLFIKVYRRDSIDESIPWWTVSDFFEFIERFDEIIDAWLREIENFKSRYNNEAFKKSLEKLENALKLLKG